MEPLDRQATLDLARAFVADQGGKLVHAIVCAQAVIDADAREARYQARVVELQDELASVTASGVANAKRHAVDLAAERRIRDAIAAGATDAVQQWATGEALENVDCAPNSGTLYRMSRAYLALSEAHAEARSTLRSIGEQALALLGKGT